MLPAWTARLPVVPDFWIFLVGCALCLAICWLITKLEGARRAGTAGERESPPADPVPVAVRLQTEHQQRLRGTHVRAVRPRHERVVVPFQPSAKQLAAVRRSKRERE